VNQDNFGVKWSGFIHIEMSGEYSFFINADDGVHFYLDEDLLIDEWSYQNKEYTTDALYLEEGLYPFLVEFYEGSGASKMELLWSSDHFGKEAVPAEAFWYTDNWGIGRGGVYIINGQERFPGVASWQHPLKATMLVSSMLSSFREMSFGVREFGKQTVYLGDLNGDSYHELGVSATLDGNESMDRLHILHGAPLTTHHDFRELIPNLPEEDGGSKNFTTLFDPVEWAGPITGNGGLLDASPKGNLLLDSSQGNSAYAYLTSSKSVSSGLDLSMKFGRRVEAEEHPVLRIMNHSLTLPELGEGARQDDSSLLVLYDNGSVKLRASPGAEPLQLEGAGLNTFPGARVVVSPEHDRIFVYFNDQLLFAMDIRGWEEALYLVLGDSSSDRYDKTSTLVWLRPDSYVEALNFNVSGVWDEAMSFAGGKLTKDGNHQLVVGARETYLFTGQGMELLPCLGNETILFGEGNFTNSFYRNGSLTVSGELAYIIPNGDFDRGWENWSFDKNSQDQKLAKERLVEVEVGDWKLSPLSGSPTAGYGVEDDTLDAQNGQSTGMLRTDPFNITSEVDHLRLWRRWKVMSFDSGEGMNIKLYRASDDTELLTIDEWMAPGDSQDHEAEGIFTVDVRELRGETAYLAMETIGGDGAYDDALFQLDDVAALGTRGSGSFVSKEIALPNSTKAVIPQWVEEGYGGTVTFRIRTSNETAWENASQVQNGQFLHLVEGIESFQFRFDISIKTNHSSPDIKQLEFIFFNETSMPLRINSSGAYYPYLGDISGDGLHELLLGSGSEEELLVIDGSDIENALDSNMEFFEKENYLMKFWPGSGETSEKFGSEVSMVRDIDGDGLRDILVSDPACPKSGMDAGAIYLFYSSDTTKDYSIADAAFEISGGVEGSRMGTCLEKSLASRSGGVNPRVEHLPFHLSDVAITTFSLENNSFIFPNSTLEFMMNVANIGFLKARDIEYFINISSDQGNYNTSLSGNFSEIDVDGSKDVTVDWDVPGEEDARYTIHLTLTMKEDLSLDNNERAIKARSRYFKTELSSGRLIDYKRVHEYLIYTVTITNTGTMGDDTVNLSAQVPEHWEYGFRHGGEAVSSVRVVQEEVVEFRVRSPTNATVSNDSYDFTVIATSQNNITSSKLPLLGYLVDVDIVAVEINLYRKDMVEIGSTKHLIEKELSTLEMVLFNDGNLSTCPFNVKILQDESLMEQIEVESLASKTYLNITRGLVLAPGDTSFRVVVDQENQCFEYREQNNELFRQTTVKDNDPDNEYHVYCTIRNMDRQLVEGAKLLVNVEGNSHEFWAETNETGQAHLVLISTDYYEGLQMKVGGVKGSKYDYTLTPLYSDDGEFRTNLMLEKYSLDVWVDSLSKVMSLDDEKTAYEAVEYHITVENSGILDEDYELYAIRPFGWRYEFRGNITDRGAGLYDLTVKAESSEELVFCVFNTDRMDSPISKNIYGNQKVNITFFVNSKSTPFVIERTTITHVRPVDNLTIDGLNTDGKLYEENGIFYKDLVPGSSSYYIINLINFGNTNKDFFLLNHGENASFAEIDRSNLNINCLHSSHYRDEFTVNLTVPRHLKEGERFHLDLLLIDENNTFSEYVKLGVVAKKLRDVVFFVREETIEVPRYNRTQLLLDVINPTANEIFVRLDSAEFSSPGHTGSILFSRESLSLAPGEIVSVNLTVDQDNMEETTVNEDLELIITAIIDNSTIVKKQVSYPVPKHHKLSLTTPEAQAVFYPGLEHTYILTLENLGNGPRELASFVIEDPEGWGSTLEPMFLNKGEERTIMFKVKAPEDTENGVYNNITIIPIIWGGDEQPAICLVNQVDPKARSLSLSYFDSRIFDDHINYTLKLRNNGAFSEHLRAEVRVAENNEYFMVPRYLMVPDHDSRDINLEVKKPEDDANFSSYTVDCYPEGGDSVLASLELPAFPVSRIEFSADGRKYTFTATSLSSGDNSYFWEINDGIYSLEHWQEEAERFTVNFTRAGTYTVSLKTRTLNPEVGALSDESSLVITIDNSPPDISLIPEQYIVHTNQELVIDGLDLANDEDGFIWDLMFSLNGSTVHATSFSTTFDTPGEYIVTITVVDNLGAMVTKDIHVLVLEEKNEGEKDSSEHLLSRETTYVLWFLTLLLFVVVGILSQKKKEKRGDREKRENRRLSRAVKKDNGKEHVELEPGEKSCRETTDDVLPGEIEVEEGVILEDEELFVLEHEEDVVIIEENEAEAYRESGD